MITTDPKILGLAIIGGFIPALFWLWFWLKEDNQNPEPTGLIASIFIIGMISIVFVIPAEKFIKVNVISPYWQTIIWASIEELFKYLAVLILLFKTDNANEPIDWPIFLITAALGFAAIENTLFIIKPLALNQTTIGLLTGQLRFLGSTLLHAVASGIIGISLGLSYFMGKFSKFIYLLFGISLAIILHSSFNFFIIESGKNNMKVLGFLWVVTIIIILLFEKLRRMSFKNL